MYKPADVAAIVVVVATLPATSAAVPCIVRVEPQLNPYQPNQRIRTPSVWKAALCWASLNAFLPNLPFLGPGKKVTVN